MADLTITSDHKWRNMTYGADVPKSVAAREFDYIDDIDERDGFFQYRGVWYDSGEFTVAPKPLADLGWQAYHADSFFSGIVLNISSDGEQYQVGTYYS